MSNAIQPRAESSRPAYSNEAHAKGKAFEIDYLKPSRRAIRELWSDLLTLLSIGVCFAFLLKAALQLLR